ncbi:MAG: GntR family transcriptional regulator [Caldilineaceae bacterium]
MGNPATKISEANQSYEYLHHAIVRGDLLPNQRLVELELAKQLGVGRAAIRTALDRLAHDGLVAHEPNRGAHVRLVSLEEAIEMMEARAVLEGLAMRKATLNATAQEIADLQAMLVQMETCLAAGDLLTISEINAQLHAALLRIAKHQTVTRLLEQLQASHVRFQYRMILVPGRATHSLQEHRAIIEAILARDADAAEAAMRLHLSHSVDALRQSNTPARERLENV